MTTSAYTMQRHTKQIIEHAYGPVHCYRCGKSIQVGQAVVSIHHCRRRNYSFKIYHAACYESMLL